MFPQSNTQLVLTAKEREGIKVQEIIKASGRTVHMHKKYS